MSFQTGDVQGGLRRRRDADRVFVAASAVRACRELGVAGALPCAVDTNNPAITRFSLADS